MAACIKVVYCNDETYHKLLTFIKEESGEEGEESVAATLSDGVASATLPVSMFMYGTHKVYMSLMEGGKVIGESSCDFTRHACLPVRRVYFDELNRTVVDDKPFFPLGMFFNDINARMEIQNLLAVSAVPDTQNFFNEKYVWRNHCTL